jgi:hypothetical protein
MTDYCAGCGEPLRPRGFGSRYACCYVSEEIPLVNGAKVTVNRQVGYWSTAEPLQADARGYRQMTGHEVRVDRDLKFYRGIQ